MQKSFHLVIYLKDRTPHFIIGGVILVDRQNATYVYMFVSVSNNKKNKRSISISEHISI